MFPLSHSNVEKVFNHKNTVKCHFRDKLSIKTLTEVLNTKYGLKFNGLCCYNYKLPNYILKKTGFVEFYKTPSDELF